MLLFQRMHCQYFSHHMISMASSELPNNLSGGATAAPPPTPSAQPNHLSKSDAADALSMLFHRLPPSLSLPTRRSSQVTCPPSISLADHHQANPALLSPATQLGFFQLTDHNLPSGLAKSAESESLALFELPREKKEAFFPKNWPVGFQPRDEDPSNGGGISESFCLESSNLTNSTELSLSSLREFAGAMEKLGLKIIQALSDTVGFDNPVGEQSTSVCSLTWITEGLRGNTNNPTVAGGFYPYIVGLHYQIRPQKYSLLADSGLVTVLPKVDSVLVTIGDIAQVWCNGKLKKVRGRPVAVSGDGENSQHCIWMTLLVTLPVASTVSPLPVSRPKVEGIDSDEVDGVEEPRKFQCFSFEDYAWRAYHERFFFKDPLDRYRI